MKTYHHRVAFDDFAIDLGGAAELSPDRPLRAFHADSDDHARMLAEIAAGEAELVEDA